MKRPTPFFSPVSILFTLIVFSILGLMVWRSGGAGFNPGAVTAKTRTGQALQGFTSHAEFENRCEYCHQPLASPQNDLCVRCHTSISTQIASGSGLHARLAPSSRCYTCHPEHRGRDFDPSQFALDRLDHTTTGFPLVGKHAEASCVDCHMDEPRPAVSRTCVDCHAEPEIHQGMFSQDCSGCHDPESWKPARIDGQVFDHARLSFTLERHVQDEQGQLIACTACHAAGLPGGAAQAATVDQAVCASCHRDLSPDFMGQHLADYGNDCLQCHNGGTGMRGFSHEQVFPLDGAHTVLECQACHPGQRFNNTPTACSGCHEEPAVHTGYFGSQCGDCHTTAAWKPAHLQAHSFPLDHGEVNGVDCRTCHPSSYTTYSCTTCHEHQPDEISRKHTEEGISAAELPECARCHPTGKEKG